MSERRLPNKVPLRVRFRSPAEQAQWERENLPLSTSLSPSTLSHAPDLTHATEIQKRTQQTRELIRLGQLLRADLSLNEVLQQIAATIVRCTGFRMLAVNLIDEDRAHISKVAFAGLSEEDERILRSTHDSVDKISHLMRPEFLISQSYFISHEYASAFTGTAVMSKSSYDDKPGNWHPEDLFIVPLFSPREQKMLGFLSLDDPEDGKLPTEESIQVTELFANQAAIAIDNARLFQEREAERIALEESIAQLRSDLEPIQRGDLSKRLHLTHQKLQPIGEALNVMLGEISGILKDVQLVTQAVEEHSRNVQRSSEFLVRDTSQQERQVNQISKVISDLAEMMHQISEQAAHMSRTAVDAVEVTNNAQETIARAVEGMGKVREATMQSARTMKSLGERGQAIGETAMEVSDLGTRLHHLALNAAIEATRAGEYGKGFATIAQEIRTLAVSSSEIARNIITYIRTIQNETNAASHSVEQNTQQVVMQSELVTQTGVALEVIGEVTDQLSKLIEDVCSTAGNQTQGSQLVVSSVEEILYMTADITQHMREMRQSMIHMVDLANSLRQRILVFRIADH
ncbi:MAG: GAF domain-containing protein [Ktedonobacteraceae bacterium]|nr:GAF domain-containing protein [Ktedonobacteraceae bacterium]